MHISLSTSQVKPVAVFENKFEPRLCLLEHLRKDAEYRKAHNITCDRLYLRGKMTADPKGQPSIKLAHLENKHSIAG
jgi:hypothetical protein